ncbi:HTH-type transcriptional activator Btr [Sporomusa ovata DSM 2662]|uniref:DNA-binding response regulator, AraC family n=1 Tax=Sporomusa ovata TaxID=2378 RepID=A0A0U1L5I4_9FIRM|nr:PocR ligand-binding domain-containing protein [Sporomusa ovata]EQB28588.1 regulatory protein PocR [Sporomusa ovata DSM 2662]CQR74920.1 DNA-binding response regulator, AraC family [Sporomusa ovata]
MKFNQTSLDKDIGDILPLLDSFSTLHQIWLKFVSCNGDYIVTPKKKSQSEYCHFIRSCPEGLKRCRASVTKCMYFEPDKHYILPCHAGLFILAIPLHSNSNCIGALATGEIRISGTFNQSNLKEKVQDLNLDTKKLLRLYEKIPVIKREKIMILGESIHTISNCLIKLGIKSETARMVDQTILADINEENPLLPRNISVEWSHQIVQQASRYIYINFKKSLSLEEVANYVHLSPTYFSYLFSQVRKQTFSNFLMETRLEKAKELLEKYPTISISEISRIIGYDDSNYFSRVFKKKIGVSPSSYRHVNSQLTPP